MGESQHDLPHVPPIIVGVGASAGGLEALQRFFERVRKTGSLAFVVVQHLSPDFKSVMDELLSRHTDLTIHRAEHGMVVEPDAIYLMPPKKEMIISGGRLLLTERDPDQDLALPIDGFFRSLAEDAGVRAVAVVLSGTGSDGSRGIRAVHEAGGLVIAQSEESAKFDGMPRSAVDTGIVDWVLSPEGIAEALLKFAEHDGEIAKLVDDMPGDHEPMSRIFELLKKESGIDFAGYKSSTIRRRIERRLILSDTLDLERYADLLTRDGDELSSLYRDLLIGVTRFFRDPEAFERLRSEIIVPLARRAGRDEEVRIWVAACATGEEAYSIAMLLLDAFRELGRAPVCRIFATDVHRHSLDIAAAGVYPAESVAGLPSDLRDRYFAPHANGYTVISELRSAIVFAHHNVLRDAPFTRVDLISCRNFLIYLKPAAQRKVISLFHFALRTGGNMLLGPSETPGALSDEFEIVDARWKLFKKRRDVRLYAPEVRLAGLSSSDLGRPPVRQKTEEEARVDRARGVLLERYAPPALLVDQSYEIVHTFRGGQEFLRPREGRPSINLLELLAGELRFVVSGALRRMSKDQKRVSYAGVDVETSQGRKRVTVVVEPVVGARNDDLILVSFENERLGEAPAAGAMPTDISELARERIAALELELKQTKETLQSTVEELETGNEELQATNEELIASNEELQSTNEELHSVNEELYTVNAEYQAKITELTELTADMNHLLEGTEVHTLFLDRDLRLRRFTKGIADVFNLLPQDIGRRIEGFAHSLEEASLVGELNRVLKDGVTLEREVRDRRGKHFLLRILPYRPAPSPDGVVLTLIDISLLKRAERDLKESEERFRTLVRAVPSVLWSADPNGKFVEPQPEWETYTGLTQENYLGDQWLSAIHEEDRERIRNEWSACVAKKEPFSSEGRLFHGRTQQYRYFHVRAAPIFDNGAVREWVGHFIDTHEAKANDVELKRKDSQLKGILANSPAFVYLKDRAGKYLLAGKQSERILGVPAEEVVGRTDHDFLAAAVADKIRETERLVIDERRTTEIEELIPVDGEERTFLSVKFPLTDDRGEVYAVGGIVSEITELRRAADEDRRALEQRDRFLAMLSHELRTPLGAILNASELLDLDEPKRERPLDPVQIIRRQARHMARLLDDLLDVARIRRDKLVIARERVDLVQVIDTALAALHPTLEQHKLEIVRELPNGPTVVVGDPARLQQIVANLLSNAVKFTHQGTIKVSLTTEDGEARIVVDDTGRGMSREQLDRVFELFYQGAQPADRPLGGLGVGLTLVQRLVDLHGGSISAFSDGPGRGSRFVVELPLSDQQIVAGVTQDERRPGKLSIVLVEDSPEIRDTMRTLLELQGHEVLTASDGSDGLKIILEHSPDVALVDIGLPGLDGYDLARRVREARGGTVRLFAVTGYGRSEDRAKAAEAGFDEHLVKPVDPARISGLLANLTRERRERERG
jgi:two-component system, chemotaxis family, CheB/CheR fusion protein